MSEKQIAVVKRLANKYIEKIADPERLKTLLKLDEVAEIAKAAGKPEIDEALAKLSQIKTWKKPVKKGKRVFDDKEFYESLKKQYEERRILSSRQEYALKKLVGKYEEK